MNDSVNAHRPITAREHVDLDANYAISMMGLPIVRRSSRSSCARSISFKLYRPAISIESDPSTSASKMSRARILIVLASGK